MKKWIWIVLAIIVVLVIIWLCTRAKKKCNCNSGGLNEESGEGFSQGQETPVVTEDLESVVENIEN